MVYLSVVSKVVHLAVLTAQKAAAKWEPAKVDWLDDLMDNAKVATKADYSDDLKADEMVALTAGQLDDELVEKMDA